MNFLTTGKTSIAYEQLQGKSPGVIFCGGFASDMTGTKASALENFCRHQQQAYVRFDYQGHGASSGKFTEGTITQWLTDSLAVLGQLTQGPQILVGSSMGGWIALLMALAVPEKIKAIVGVAAAPDFTEDLIWDKLTLDEKNELLKSGFLPANYPDQPYIVTQKLIQDARQHLLLSRPIELSQPVRLLHGMQDTDVPWQRSILLTEKLQSQDVKLTLIKDGDHRLAREKDLLLLTDVLKALIQ